jgi:peptide/nickel transport system ATP-binding protein
MYAGRVVERGTVDDVYAQARHPYTRGLLSCLPSLTHPRARLATLSRDPAWAEAR